MQIKEVGNTVSTILKAHKICNILYSWSQHQKRYIFGPIMMSDRLSLMRGPWE